MRKLLTFVAAAVAAAWMIYLVPGIPPEPGPSPAAAQQGPISPGQQSPPNYNVFPNGTAPYAVAATFPTHAPAGTASLTLVSTGVGVTVTAGAAGLAFVTGGGQINNGTAGDGCAVRLVQSTAAIPAANASLGGADVQIGYQTSVSMVTTASVVMSHSVSALVSSLTPGSKYFFYLAYAAVTGGTCTLSAGTSSGGVQALNL